MSNIFDGADCGPSNALSSVVKHAEVDRSLQRDRIGGPSATQLHHLPQSKSRGPSEADQAMARRFFENAVGPSSSMPAVAAAVPFSAAHPQSLGGSRQITPPVVSVAQKSPEPLESLWKSRESPQLENNLSYAPAAWTAEFGVAGPATSGVLERQLRQNTTTPALSIYSTPVGAMGGMYGLQAFTSPMRQSPLYASAHLSNQLPDWDAEFSKVAETANKDKGKGRLTEVTDENLEEAFKQLHVESREETEVPADLEDYMTSFEKVWEEVKAQNPAASLEELSKMEADYRQLLQQRNELDAVDPEMLQEMSGAWTNGFGLDMEGLDADFGLNNIDVNMPRYDEHGIPTLAPYTFDPDNPYLELPPGALLARAKELLATNGSLDEGALLCEAAIQKGELGDGGFEAWILLGRARSMDEREAQALKALQEGTRIAQEHGNMEAGMLDLAISYVNESYDLASHYCLRQWLYSKYKDMNLPWHPPTHYNAAWSSHELTSEAFLQVARTLHAQGKTDPDVQGALGVLFYSNTDFEKAKDCFESALHSRPDDYLLWNRLGSCLSNGAKPEEALGAYREALRLRPTYTRAIYNVGVACLNIGAHQEAIEHFLHALTLRGPDREAPKGFQMELQEDRSADQIWRTLIRTATLMNRPDLIELARKGDITAFRPEFEF